jgi:hypothetical protein
VTRDAEGVDRRKAAVDDGVPVEGDVLIRHHRVQQRLQVRRIEAVLEQAVDGRRQRLAPPRTARPAVGQAGEHERQALVGRLALARAHMGDVTDCLPAGRENAPRFEMSDQGVEAGVMGNHMEERIGLPLAEATDVERDVEVQRIGAHARDLDVFGPGAQALHPLGEGEGDAVLLGADEHHHLERPSSQQLQPLGLQTLEVDQDVVRSHRRAPGERCRAGA